MKVKGFHPVQITWQSDQTFPAWKDAVKAFRSFRAPAGWKRVREGGTISGNACGFFTEVKVRVTPR